MNQASSWLAEKIAEKLGYSINSINCDWTTKENKHRKFHLVEKIVQEKLPSWSGF